MGQRRVGHLSEPRVTAVKEAVDQVPDTFADVEGPGLYEAAGE